MSKIGRGGAGNYVSKETEQAEKARISEDLEAQTQPQSQSSASEPPVVRTGRGGAGNWSSPADASQADALEASAAKSLAARRLSQNKGGAATSTGWMNAEGGAVGGAAPMTRGRGGAGNYEGAAAEERWERERLAADQRTNQDRVRREVEGEVDGVLRPPGRAHVSERERKDAGTERRGDLESTRWMKVEAQDHMARS